MKCMKILSEYLNVKNYIWLKRYQGDDTHGHIDDIQICRFNIMTAIENDKKM